MENGGEKEYTAAVWRTSREMEEKQRRKKSTRRRQSAARVW
jgi:hypothetical protein